MFFTFPYTVTASDIAGAEHEIDINLTAGVVHQVDVLFQSGTNHNIHVQIFESGHQLWPSNRGESLIGDATVISFREFHPLSRGRHSLTAKVWTDDTDYLYEVVINIGLLPREIIQPLSFEELLRAAAGYRR